MLSDYILLAFKNVRKRGIRSWLTMLGVFIGIAAVVSLISLGQGLETAITGQFGTLSVDTLTVQGASTGFAPPGSTAVTPMTEHDLKIIESVPGIKIAIPRFLRVSKVEFNKVVSFGYIVNVPEKKDQLEEVYNTLNLGTVQGRMLQLGDRGKIVVGNDFIKNDVYGKPIKVGSILTLNGQNFEVVGILERSSSFTFNGVILMMESDMKDLFNVEDEIDFIAVKVANKNDVAKVASEIERKIRKDRGQKVGEEDFQVQTPLQSLQTVTSILNVINIVVTGIALIALLVGGIGIMNTMFTSVLERTKEIGVMKAIGAKNKDILTVFLTESAMLGLVGGIVGAIMGLSLAFAVSQIANAALGNAIFVINPSIPLLVGSVMFSLLIGVISGLVPAFQASKLNPVDALRK
jgi:putative ABC transport system permease protein